VSLRARLLIALGYLVALVIVAFAVPLGLNLRDRVGTEVRADGRSQADVLAAGVGRLIAARDEEQLGEVAEAVGGPARARVVVVDRRGRVLADTADDEAIGVDFSSRPELAAALAGRRFQDQRHSDTLDQEILATAAPVFDAGRVVGAVRLTQSVDAVNDAVRRTVVGIAAVGLAVLLAAFLAAFLLARGITRPLERLGAAADRIASGDLDARAPVEGSREQRSLARSFNLMTERLARALRAQTEFVADASHQLRTPLTGLRLRIEEARVSPDRSGAERHLDAGLQELDRMSHTIDDLLVLSRTGEREGQGEEIDLADAVADARRRWERTAQDRGIALAAELDGAGSVWASRADLDRAVDAVLENALHYTPRGGHVTVRGAAAAIEVLDDGPGLAAGEEDDVFARFHRGRAGRGGGAPGTGLGLPIARELMRAWDGDATLDNRPEGGAQATLSVPPFAGSFPGAAYSEADA
jgi:two-component system, OmpR family, sensor kinase